MALRGAVHAPQSTPYARRVAGSSYSLGVLINSFARNFSIFHLTNAISVIDCILNRINVMALRGAVHAPQSTPYARRVAGSSYSLGVLINSFARNFSIFHLTNAISVIDCILNRINVMALRGAVHAPQSTPYARRVAGSSYSLGVLINSFARNFSIFWIQCVFFLLIAFIITVITS